MLPESLARELITAHHKRPHHFGALAGAPSRRLENQGCGDQVTVWAELREGTLAVSFEGQGCAISQASASMMTDALAGRSRREATALAAQFRAMILGEAAPAAELGELQALAGVSRLHARRRCALLAWRALEGVLEEEEG